MTQQVKIIKTPKFPFDAALALLDANNTEKIFSLHLSRCDDKEAAREIGEVFSSLSKKFLDLSKEIS